MFLAGDRQRPRQVGDAEGPDFGSPLSLVVLIGTVDLLHSTRPLKYPEMHICSSQRLLEIFETLSEHQNPLKHYSFFHYIVTIIIFHYIVIIPLDSH